MKRRALVPRCARVRAGEAAPLHDLAQRHQPEPPPDSARPRKEAIQVLAPAYEWFVEGADTRDLRQARELLEDLRLMRASA